MFLLLDNSLDQILDGDHSLKLTIASDNRQVTDIGLQHLLHTLFDGIFRLGSDELAALGGDLLDLGVLGSASEKSDFGDVITLTDNSGEFSLKIGKKRVIHIVRFSTYKLFHKCTLFSKYK